MNCVPYCELLLTVVNYLKWLIIMYTIFVNHCERQNRCGKKILKEKIHLKFLKKQLKESFTLFWKKMNCELYM